jgi:START domain
VKTERINFNFRAMKIISIFFFLIGFFTCETAISQEAWTLKKDKNGIKVFARKTKGIKFNELKVESVFDGKISQLAAVILDVNKQKDWVYKTIKSELVKEINAADVFYYTEIEVPWPFDNRDLVVHMTIQQNPQNKVTTIVAKNVDDYLPARKNKVRVKYSNALWIVTPISGSQFKVEYTIQIDPGDGVPAWLLNLFSTSGPFESFKNLKEKMLLSQYRQAKFPFLTD